MFFVWIIGIVLYVVLVYMTATIAGSKGHSALGFGILAVFLPVIALIIAFLLPNKMATR